jgi:hypothetical protein
MARITYSRATSLEALRNQPLTLSLEVPAAPLEIPAEFDVSAVYTVNLKRMCPCEQCQRGRALRRALAAMLPEAARPKEK